MNLNIRKIAIDATLALAGVLLLSGHAAAQAYPNKPITFVYPYPAGAGLDIALRTASQDASRRLGQPIVFVSRPGAGGRVGFESLMRSPNDGYTIGAATNAIAVFQPLIDQKLFVEPGKDYTAISLAIETPLVLVTGANSPFRDVKGLLANAKANPGKLNGGSSGVGTGSHLGIEMINVMGGTNIVHIPFNGATAVLVAAMSGDISMVFSSAETKPHIASGKLIALATSGSKRWHEFPNVPTMSEAGLTGFVNGSWTGIVGPAGMPREMVLRLTQAYTEALKTVEVREKLEGAGWVILAGSPEEFIALARDDMERFRPIIKAANLKMN